MADNLGFEEDPLGFEADPADTSSVATADTPPDLGAVKPEVKKSLLDLLTPAGGIAGAMAGAQFSPQLAAAMSGLGPIGTAAGAAIPPIAGAFVGGAGVEAWEQNIKNLFGKEGTPESSMEAIQAIAQAGKEQAEQEVAGRLFLGTARLGARQALQVALKSSPEIAKVALKEGITATKAGWAKLTSRWKAVTDAEQQIAQAAGDAGHRIDMHSVADAAFDDVAKRLKGSRGTGDFKALTRFHRAFTRKKAALVKPATVLAIKKYNDTAARGLYKAREGGKRGVATVREMWQEAVGNHSRQALYAAVPDITNPEAYRRITGKAGIPQEIVKLKEVLGPVVMRSPSVGRKVLERGGPAAVGAGVGATMQSDNRVKGAVEGAAIGATAGAAFSPQVLSSLAMLSQNPAFQQILLNLPRAGMATVRQSE